jgi:hypothetical protein
MIRKTITSLAALLAAAGTALVLAGAAFAQDAAIDQAKAQGVVGEMYTGYLGFPDASKASADLKRRVDEVNARRLTIYTTKSQETAQPVATIAALTAEKQIARAGAGEVVKPGASDPWTKKP